MFGKKKCDSCGEKIEDKYNFCPYCRTEVNQIGSDEDWGLLGKSDAIDANEIRMPMGLNALFNSLVKSLNSQMKELEQEGTSQKDKKTQKKSRGISISISTSNSRQPEIKVRSFGNMPELTEKQKETKKQKPIQLPTTSAGKFTGLPKKEPETGIRRLSNRVIYEIKLPGVKSTKDISIAQLENSIEIKALADKKVFYKVIPISLSIRKYDLSDGTLVLELDSKE